MQLFSRSTVLKLNARGASVRSASVQNAVRVHVENADLEPRGLPPSAVLLVRGIDSKNVPVPLPPGLDDRRAVSKWEQACRGELEERLTHAARPVNGRVPDNADAVLFEDESELIAARAMLDVGDQTAIESWWARSVQQAVSTHSLAALMLERAELVPAIFDRLDEWGDLPAIALDISAEDSMAIAVQVAQTWGVSLPYLMFDEPGSPDHATDP